ncbi:restriction endonuclease subunit S [uncultured Tenacibaculum sp.]|uniref:restriction endonuclease subunit S n=1 Tax=uncultured Tenacibaculum sp. TaxID=174713 RepID=UPI00261C18AF|nr:restriction endonuclease subunit S [uncultured Tenacibaculum sp.]
MQKSIYKEPKIRFPEFNDKWKSTLLSELLVESKTKNKDLNFTKDDVLSVSKEYGIINQIEHLGRSYAGASVHNYGVVDVGDIVYTKSPLKENPYGIIKVNKNKTGIVSTLYAIYKAKNESVIESFIDYYFSLDDNTNRYLRPLVRKGAKNDMKINNDFVLSDSIYIPSKKEQKRIVDFLEELDNQITLLDKELKYLQDFKKGILQKIFSKKIRFKDKNGNQFPEWGEKKLGDLTFKVGKKNKENIQYPIYSINNKEGFRPQSEQFEGLDSNERGYDISMYKIIKEKTFAYNPARINVGSIGFSYELNNIIISSLYVCFKTNEELEDSYLLTYLDSYDFNKAVLRNAEGGVRQYLFYDNFSRIKIPLPSNEEQIKISNFILNINKEIELCSKKIDETKEYKKALLQQMFI